MPATIVDDFGRRCAVAVLGVIWIYVRGQEKELVLAHSLPGLSRDNLELQHS